ncbi:tyrosine-type recombinase/integrase [Flavobacterium sp. HJ-32-4]|uniref:tyrosine-type recombinase/integrase n=1 Tax=Flavobacterium sp. HJ-32-4 TaxID=1160795 RepID=UPI001F12B83D|nr:tyrosine-type recombinase/integrase [Flavobacterium sp. HJ-32-4]UMY66250.1 tyrosine-type recombinase/integrase [Flavobacterium sp. HJ-32-4]
MKKTTALLPLFTQFIRDSETGKRLKKNGEKIRPQSIDNYRYVHQNLVKFSTETGFVLLVSDASKLNAREYQVEKNYWKKFYRNFTNFLYKQGCHDNYVGANIKVIRTFFTYLKTEKNLDAGDFHKAFYVRKEEIPVLVLSPEQLKFLIHDDAFARQLLPSERRVKDAFVFGCTTGLRFSDLFLLTNQNFEPTTDGYYLKQRSKKTKTYTRIKLPPYAAEIYERYRLKEAAAPVFGSISLFNFNKTLKQVGAKAGFIHPVDVTREKLGRAVRPTAKKESGRNRFCDQMSSHMMRRTAITTLLTLGMPEHAVRNLSGHSANSTSFRRYVHYAQAYLDEEMERVHKRLER